MLSSTSTSVHEGFHPLSKDGREKVPPLSSFHLTISFPSLFAPHCHPLHSIYTSSSEQDSFSARSSHSVSSEAAAAHRQYASVEGTTRRGSPPMRGTSPTALMALKITRKQCVTSYNYDRFCHVLTCSRSVSPRGCDPPRCGCACVALITYVCGVFRSTRF
jgi:hypothetical protein